MVVDGFLGFIVIWKLWRWRWWTTALLMVPIILIDVTFLAANLLKLFEGAWVPLAVRRRHGADHRDVAARHAASSRSRAARIEVPLDAWSTTSRSSRRTSSRAPPCSSPAIRTIAPTALLHNLKHNKVLHEQNVILTDRDRRHAARDRRRPRADEPIRRASPRRAEVRLHGIAERAEGARDRAQARLAVRHHVDVVLPVAALAQTGRPFRHAALAGPAVHRARAIARTTPPTSSRSRPAAWWRSARRSRSNAG